MQYFKIKRKKNILKLFIILTNKQQQGFKVHEKKILSQKVL